QNDCRSLEHVFRSFQELARLSRGGDLCDVVGIDLMKRVRFPFLKSAISGADQLFHPRGSQRGQCGSVEFGKNGESLLRSSPGIEEQTRNKADQADYGFAN